MNAEAFQTKCEAELKQARRQLASMARQSSHLDLRPYDPGLPGSRVGGPIAWHPDAPIPQDPTGQPMATAIQINCADLGGPPGFPSAGLLQLFIAANLNSRGIACIRKFRREGDCPLRNGQGFQLVFHPTTHGLVSTSYQILDDEFAAAASQIVREPHAIVARAPVAQLPPMTHWQGSQAWGQFEQLPDVKNSNVELDDLLAKEVWDEQAPGSFRLGGYACLCQLDHRRFFEEYRSYDTCVMDIAGLPGLRFADMNLAILIAEKDLRQARSEDTLMIADTD